MKMKIETFEAGNMMVRLQEVDGEAPHYNCPYCRNELTVLGGKGGIVAVCENESRCNGLELPRQYLEDYEKYHWYVNERSSAETFEAKVYDPMMQKKIDQNECTHKFGDGEDAWNLVYSDIDRNEFSYVYATVKCDICSQERYGSWGINEKEGFEIVKGEEGRMPKMYGFYGAETFEANGCVGCQMQKPVSEKERVAIQKQVNKFNEQLALDPDDDFERYILLDLDDENLIEDAFFSRQTWKPLTEAFRKRWGERSELMDKISIAQLGEKSNWSIYSFEKPFWFEYETDPQDTATAEDPEGYGLGFEFDMTKEEAIEKARQIHKETKGAITMYNTARKRSGGGSTRIHPKFWATPEMMEEQKEYYKREGMKWPTGDDLVPYNFNAETFDAEKSEYGMICNCGNTSGWIVRSWTSQGQAPEGFFNTVYHIECPSCREYVITYQRNDSRKSPFKKNAEYNVEFNEWADQELMSHGKDISFKDWAQDEGMKHGNTEITEWAQHEDESHDARYGAEEHRFMIACGRCGWNFTDEYIKNNTDGNIRPMYGDHCSCGGMVKRYDFEPEAKPKGFFKKLFGKNAESNQFPSMHYGDHDSDVQEKYQEMLDEWDYDEDPPSIEEWIKEEGEYDRRLQEYEGTEEYRKAMEEMERRMQEDFNAEGKKRSGLLSEPFEGTSLDSGEWKGILTGFSIGLLGLFGYSKLRK
jgi:hypothetical protein